MAPRGCGADVAWVDGLGVRGSGEGCECEDVADGVPMVWGESAVPGELLVLAQPLTPTSNAVARIHRRRTLTSATLTRTT